MKKKNSFWGNVGLLLLGSVFAQVITAGALVVLTRVYSPDDFGVLGNYVATIMIVGSLSMLRYDLAIPLPKSDQEGAKILVLSLGILMGITLITALVCWGFGEQFKVLFHLDNLGDTVWIVPLGVVGVGSSFAMAAWLARRGHFQHTSLGVGLQGITQAGSQIGMSFGPLGALGLVLGNLAGQVLAGIYYFRTIWQLDRSGFQGIQFHHLREVAAKYWRFPAISFWSGCAMILNQYLPILLMSGLFGKAYAGLYLIGQRVLHLPVGLISRAVGSVFLPEYSRKHGTEESDKMAGELFQRLLLQGFPVLLLIGFTAPVTIPLVFGTEWTKAGWMTAWLTPWLGMAFVYAPISTIPLVHGKQGREMAAQLMLLLTRVLPFLILGNTWSADQVFCTFVISTTVSAVLYMFWIARLTGQTMFSICRSIGHALFRSSILLILPFALTYFIHSNWLTFASVALVAVIWLIYIFKLNHRKPSETTVIV